MIKKIKVLEKINIILIILSVFACIIFLIYSFSKKDDKNLKIEDTILNYNYVLYEKDVELYKTEFMKLKQILGTEKINFEEYAKSISKLFIIDFYTFSNKYSNQDIGGIQYVESSFKDNLILNASNTIYKYIMSSSKIPVVNDVIINKVEESKFEYNNKSYDSFEVSLDWDYEYDYGYEKNGTLILVKDKNQLFIVEKK